MQKPKVAATFSLITLCFHLLRQGLLLNPELTDLTSLTSQVLPSSLPRTGITGRMQTHSAFVDAGDTNSGLQAYSPLSDL